MAQKRTLFGTLKSSISIKQYHDYLTYFCFVLAATIAVFEAINLDEPVSHIEGIEVIKLLILPLMILLIGVFFKISGTLILDQLESEKNVLKEQISSILEGNLDNRRNLRKHDEFKEVMEKLHELAEHMKKNNG